MRIANGMSTIRRAPIIFCFHAVTETAWFDRCLTTITCSRKVVTLDVIERERQAGTCAITFDDGLRSVGEVAAPLLHRAEIPYTVFVCTEVIAGGPAPWFLRVVNLLETIGPATVKARWSLNGRHLDNNPAVVTALKQVPYELLREGIDELEKTHGVPPVDGTQFLTGEDLRLLAAQGATIGSHTHRHPIMSLLARDQQAYEVDESLRIIESHTGRRPTEFAFPNGTPLDFDSTTIDVLRERGIAVAVTTSPTHLSRDDDSLALPRVGLDDGESDIRTASRLLLPRLSRAHSRERSIRSRVGPTVS